MFYQYAALFRFIRIYFFQILLLSSLLFVIFWSDHVDAQMSKMASPEQWVRNGVEDYQQGKYSQAIFLWQEALKYYQQTENPQSSEKIAIIHENLARGYQQLGQWVTAIDYWKKTIDYYRKIKSRVNIGKLLVETAQAYNQMGQAKKAVTLICNPNELGSCTADTALDISRSIQDKDIEIAALGVLGEAYRLLGEYEGAIQVLETEIQLAQNYNNPKDQALGQMSLGNTHASLAKLHYKQAYAAFQRSDLVESEYLQTLGRQADQLAINHLQKSLVLIRDSHLAHFRLQIFQSLIPIYSRNGYVNEKNVIYQEALTILKTLPENHDRIYATLNLVHWIDSNGQASGNQIEQELPRNRCPTSQSHLQSHKLLTEAKELAQRIQDRRAESFALGALGHLAECQQDWDTAQSLTEKALWVSEQELDSRYLWEWQMARILVAIQQKQLAIQLYDQALQTLEKVSYNILESHRELQLDFRENIEPVYREVIKLRLDQELTDNFSPVPYSDNLNEVLETINLFKVVELQSYFKNDCMITNTTTKNHVKNLGRFIQNTKTAIFHSVILENKTAIILSLPDQTTQIVWIDIDEEQLRSIVNSFRRGLEKFYDDYDPKPSQKLYNLIFKPFEKSLLNLNINTIVFVQDGILRSVPMAALHDGNQFLIQRYAITTTPSLGIISEPIPSTQPLRTLALGLTQSIKINDQKFQALNYVKYELQSIMGLLPGSKLLLDDSFTLDRLQQELAQNSYPILHIATHGEFSSNPSNSFLVSGDRRKINLNQIDRLIRNTTRQQHPLELLMLTACQTAVGDERAALGLAGVAIQAGAKSAVASLWFINDAATAQLSIKFYEGIKNNLSRAEALQVAQNSLIKSGKIFAHPAYWSGLVLVGNWK